MKANIHAVVRRAGPGPKRKKPMLPAAISLSN